MERTVWGHAIWHKDRWIWNATYWPTYAEAERQLTDAACHLGVDVESIQVVPVKVHAGKVATVDDCDELEI